MEIQKNWLNFQVQHSNLRDMILTTNFNPFENISTKGLYPTIFSAIMFRNKVNHMNFKVLIEKDEDGFFTITVPSLPGCISQGATEEEAKKNIQEAIALHLESIAMNGTPIEHQKGVHEAVVAVDL
jgi:predicted RNase H-like HicB family nuclease